MIFIYIGKNPELSKHDRLIKFSVKCYQSYKLCSKPHWNVVSNFTIENLFI